MVECLKFFFDMLKPSPKIMNSFVYKMLQAFTRCLHPSYRNVVLAFDSVKISEIVNQSTLLTSGRNPPQNCLILDIKFFNMARHQFIGTISYYDNTDAAKVAHGILAYIDDLFNCDLRVCATVSSGTPEMMKIVKELGSETKVDGPILFDFGCQYDIVHIIDPSWLLRELHAFFVTQDVFFVADNKIMRASYADVAETLNGYNVTSAFRDYHFQDPRLSTTAAAKVFSYTIGQMLKETMTTNEIKRVFGDTSDFCLFFDNVFDSVNAAKNGDFVVKLFRQPCQEDTLHQKFWSDAIMLLNSMEGSDENQMPQVAKQDTSVLKNSMEGCAVKPEAPKERSSELINQTTFAQLTYLNELSRQLQLSVEQALPSKKQVKKEKRKAKSTAAKKNAKNSITNSKNKKQNQKALPKSEKKEICDPKWSQSLKPEEALPVLHKAFGEKNEKLTTAKVDDAFSFGLIDIKKTTTDDGEEKFTLTQTLYNKEEIDAEPETNITEYVTDNSKDKQRAALVNYVRKMLKKRLGFPEFNIEKFVEQFPHSPEKEIVEEAIMSLRDFKEENVKMFDDVTSLKIFDQWSKSLRGFLHLSHTLSSRHLPYFDTKVVNCDTIHDKKHLVQLMNGHKNCVRIVEHTDLEPLDNSLGDYAWASHCNITFPYK